MRAGAEPWSVRAGSVETRLLGGSALSVSNGFMFSRVLVLLLVVTTLAACTAVQRAAPRPVEVAAPATPPQPERWILVRKTERTLSLYEGTQLRKVYPIVLGKDPHWAKLHQGDHRTPEGEYHIVNKYFHPFWSRFMMLDYPTPTNQEIYAWSRAHGFAARAAAAVCPGSAAPSVSMAPRTRA